MATQLLKSIMLKVLEGNQNSWAFRPLVFGLCNYNYLICKYFAVPLKEMMEFWGSVKPKKIEIGVAKDF